MCGEILKSEGIQQNCELCETFFFHCLCKMTLNEKINIYRIWYGDWWYTTVDISQGIFQNICR